MGRKPLPKTRQQNPARKTQWARQLMPLLLAQGMRQFTMDDWVEELGCSKATLYKYFASKEELVEAVLVIKLGEIAGFAPVLADATLPFEERYDHAVRRASLHLADISTRFLKDLKEMYPPLWQRVNQLLDLAHQSLAAFYREGQNKGILRPDFDPEVMAQTDRLVIAALSDPDMLLGHNIDLKTAFDQYLEMKRKGIFFPGNFPQ
jgi:AcrR family transcriptional regulator